MDPRTFNRRSKFCQDCRSRRQTIFEPQSIARLLGWQKGQRDFWEAAFFRSKTRPESSIDDYFNRPRIGRLREFPLIMLASFGKVPRKVFLDDCGYGPSGLVSWFADHMNFGHRLPPMHEGSSGK